MLRSLVVNADDLGLTVGVNDGIFDAHDRGILTSASLFANAPATADAIRRARAQPSLGIGVHLTLVDGAPTLPPGRVPSLIAGRWTVPPSWKPFIVACLLRARLAVEVEQELTAQIERLRMRGMTLTHLDAHKHVHAYPPVFAIVARLADRFRIPVVRVPYERWSASVSGCDAAAPDGTASGADERRDAAVGARDYRHAARAGVRTPRFIGRIHTGVMTAESLERALTRASTRRDRADGPSRVRRRRAAAAGTRLLDVARGTKSICSADAGDPRRCSVAERIDV